MRLSKNWLTIFGVLAVIGVLGLGPGAELVYAEDIQHCKQVKQLSENLEKLASKLSTFLTDKESLALLSAQFKATKWKNRAVLGDFLGAALKKGLKKQAQQQEKKAELILDLAVHVQEIESTLKNLGITIPTLEVKLPVKAHRKILTSSQTVYVAVAPFADESEVKSITAYSSGKRITLSADKPPEVPTLVIISAEESMDPVYPLPTSKQPGEEKKEERVDDFVGIPWIAIDAYKEEWWCGFPEIYVKVKRIKKIPGTPWGQIITDIVNLPGVNVEDIWYWLGDPNPTYKYVDMLSYWPVMRFEVWEADSGEFHGGGDDYIASFTITWTGLPFGGYTTFTKPNARIRVDRD